MVSHQGDLLSEVGVGAEDHHFGGSPAEAFLSLLSVDSAPPGTELTAIEGIIGLLDPLSQFSLLLQFLISWMPFFLLLLFGTRGGWEEKQGAAQKEKTFNEIAAREFHPCHSMTQSLE